MIRRFLCVLVLLHLPLTVQAQQAIVRSGEHKGYSRLVAPIPEGRDWRVVHSGRDVIFTVSNYDQGFDLSNVFELISRDRVRNIAAQPNGFVISMGCDCRVAPFLEKKRFVVLDITSPGIKSSIAFIPETAATPMPKPTSVAKAESSEKALPHVSMQSSNTIKPTDLPPLARAPLSESEQESLNEVQRRLTRELGTATTRGLLTPLPGPSLPVVRRAQVDLKAIVPPDATQLVPRPNALDDVISNMRVSSSMDIPGIALKSSAPQSLAGLTCPSNDPLDIVNWADNRPFHQQTGELRRELYQEFDRLDRAAALQLARLYIYYGFGAEARQILHLDAELALSEGMLTDIAAILETGIAPSHSILHSLLDCETDVALWALLAGKELGLERTIDPRPALLSLNKLPAHLRSIVAPALSQRLLSRGDADAAATALRSLERLPTKMPPSAQLAKAHIALDDGQIAKATDGLSDIVDDNAEQSPEALIALVDTRIAEHQPISAETASLAEAYAKEMNRTELGPELRRAHVLALVKSGQFDRAFAASRELGGNSDEKSAIALRMRLLEELTEAAGDVIFLEHIFDQPPQDIGRLPAQQKVALAARMFDLGFSEQAQNIISEMADHPRSNSRQLLAARIALDLSQPMRAQVELLEMTGQDADLIRAKAMQMVGKHAEAHDLYQLADNEEAAIRAAWLADNQEPLDLSDNAVFGPILALAEVDDAPSTQTDGMLARSEATLDESSAARQTLFDLLQAPELAIE